MIKLRFRHPTQDYLLLETHVSDFELTERLNESFEWSCSLPALLLSENNVGTNSIVEAFDTDGDLLIQGELQNITYDGSDDSVNTPITGRGTLDFLYKKVPFPFAAFIDKPFLEILSIFLDWAGWRLGNVNTFEDVTRTVTLDLRNQGHLLSQIQRLCESFPNVFYRYGGFVNGYHRLDVGSFGEFQDIYFASNTTNLDATSHPILTYKEKQNFADLIEGVSAVGGSIKFTTSGGDEVQRTIRVQKYLSTYPTALTIDAMYPVIEYDVGYKTMVINPDLCEGGTVFSRVFSTSGSGVGTAGGIVYKSGFRFTPFPGQLQKFSIGFGSNVGSPVGDVRWRLYETSLATIDLSNEIATGTFTHTPQRKNTVVVENGPMLLPNKFYCLIFEMNTAQTNGNYANIIIDSTSVDTPPLVSACIVVSDGTPTYNSNMRCYFSVTTKEPQVNKGVRERKAYTQYIPALPEGQVEPTLAQTLESEISLYWRTVTYMIDKSANDNTYTIKTNTYKYYSVGDKVHVHFSWVKNEGERFLVNKQLYVLSKSVSFANDSVSVTLDLADVLRVSQENLFVAFYDVASNEEPEVDNFPVWIYYPFTTQYTDVAVSGEPNCYLANGFLGREVTLGFTPPGSYLGLETGYGAGYPKVILNTNEEIRSVIEIVEDFNFSTLTGMKVRIGFPSRDWTANDSAEIISTIFWK